VESFWDRPPLPFSDAKIEIAKNEIAVRKATLDQQKKRVEEHYSFAMPETNLSRLDSITAMEFRIQVDEWELEQVIRSRTQTEEGE